MENHTSTLKSIIYTSIFIIFLLLIIDIFTNQIDILNYGWDFREYMVIAKYGFSSEHLSAPFAYRYPTPFLAAWVSDFLNVPLSEAFKVLAYFGAYLQLMGIFWLVVFVTRSYTGAFVALIVTACSAFNVKFLLFDPFRPDHFAYFFVLLSVFLIIRKHVPALLIVSAIGVQFREFAIIPLIAYYLTMAISGDWAGFRRNTFPVLSVLVISVLLPRLLIPVTVNYQYLGSVSDVINIPMNLARDINLIYALTAYFLPVLLLLTKTRIACLKAGLSYEMAMFLSVYSVLIVVMALYGGSDLPRFMTYLFIPQMIMLGRLIPNVPKVEILYVLAATAYFNQMFAGIPMDTLDRYLDWYGGYNDRLNISSWMRALEMLVLMIGSVAIRRAFLKEKT